MDQCVLRPGPDVRDEQTRPDIMPWLDHKDCNIGLVRAFFMTVLRGMVQPGRLMRSLPTQSARPGAAIGFMAIVLLGGFALWSLSIGALLAVIGFFTNSGGGGVMFAPVFVLGCGGIGWGLTLLIFGLIAATLAHGIILITGSHARGVAHTIEAVAYTSAPFVLSGVPLIGFHLSFIALIWWIICSILAIRERQEVHAMRAVLAVLPIPVTLFGLYVVMIFGVLFSATMTTTGSITINPQTSSTQVSSDTIASPLGDGLIHFTEDFNRFPRHGAELFALVPESGATFLQTSSHGEIPFGNTNLADLIRRADEREWAYEQFDVEMRDWPADEDVIAHRIGPIIFTYHGMDAFIFDEGEAMDLWMFIVEVQNADGGMQSDLAEYLVVDTSRMIKLVPASWMDEQLADQNQLRSDFGLPALPHPDAVLSRTPVAKSEMDDDSPVDDGN